MSIASNYSFVVSVALTVTPGQAGLEKKVRCFGSFVCSLFCVDWAGNLSEKNLVWVGRVGGCWSWCEWVSKVSININTTPVAPDTRVPIRFVVS